MRRNSIFAMESKSAKGFTLIELLVVISIIALLLSIIVPSLGKAKNTTRRLICGTHMHNMGLMMETYAASNDGAYPLHYQGVGSLASLNSRSYIESLIIEGLIDGEETVAGNDEWVMTAGSDRDAYSCPSFRRFLKSYHKLLPAWQNPYDIQEKYSIGYAYNVHLSKYNRYNPATEKPYYDADYGYDYIGKNPPSSTLVLIDSTSFSVYNNSWSNFRPLYELAQGDRFMSQNGDIAGVHSGGMANSLWGDMHVEARKAGEYSRRDSSDPSVLQGSCVLNQKPHAYTDIGYTWSEPKGSILRVEK